MTVVVRVPLPDALFAEFATIARTHGLDVGPVVAEYIRQQREAARRSFRHTKPGIVERGRAIADLHALGLNDTQIGERLGLKPNTVAGHRSRLGLAAVVRGRPRRS